MAGKMAAADNSSNLRRKRTWRGCTLFSVANVMGDGVGLPCHRRVQTLTQHRGTAAVRRGCARAGTRVLHADRKRQPRTAAPWLRITSRHAFGKPFATCDATACAFCVRRRRTTRALYADLQRTRRPSVTSFKSMDRSFLRNHDQKRSTGFKSGLCGGTFHRWMLARLCAFWLTVEVKNARCRKARATGLGAALAAKRGSRLSASPLTRPPPTRQGSTFCWGGRG